jgi:deoxyribonuclease V
MDMSGLHGWELTTSQARELQNILSKQVIVNTEVSNITFIAGADISVNRIEKTATASVVLLDYPALEIIEIKTVSGELDFPYVPGLLSFRELPLTLAAFKKLTISPDLVIVDGQGIAHPRRFGLASHLGLFLDIPAIGCAKSRLCGSSTEPGNNPGDYSFLIDKGEIIGAVLRSKRGVKPIYVSTGHKIDLQSSVRWILNCCRGYRLPEPSRLAHLAAGGKPVIKKRYPQCLEKANYKDEIQCFNTEDLSGTGT